MILKIGGILIIFLFLNLLKNIQFCLTWPKLKPEKAVEPGKCFFAGSYGKSNGRNDIFDRSEIIGAGNRY